MTEASALPRFGESAILTPANIVTLARCALTVPLLTVLATDAPSWRAFLMWTVLSCTDGLDGWLARRDGTTRSGAFLDPLADKFLAIGGLSVLAAQDVFPWAAVFIIGAREVGISLYRAVAGRRGVSLPARKLGKWKTLCQLVAVGLALCPVTDSPSAWAVTTLWAAVALAVVSGIDIVRHGAKRPAPSGA